MELIYKAHSSFIAAESKVKCASVLLKSLPKLSILGSVCNNIFGGIDAKLRRSIEPNYYTIIEINFSHNQKLNLVSKITPESAVYEIIALAKEQTLAAANEIISKNSFRLCAIV